jgi:HD-GYP domain-containing protein (c-di-GMP phosphodiesterase class II)
MMHHPDSTSLPLLHTRFAGLLTRTATLLHGTLQLWSPELGLVESVPGAPPRIALGALRELGSRVAMHHEIVRLDLPGFHLLAVPVRTRAGLAAVLTACLPVDAAESGGRSSLEPMVAFLSDLGRVLEQHLDLLRETAAKSQEILFRRTEGEILHRVRRRLALPDDPRDASGFVLEQARLATYARFALLALDDGHLWVTRAPEGIHPSGSWDRRFAQHLAERIAGRMRALGERELEGPLEVVLPGAGALPHPTQLAAVELRRAEHHAGILCLLRNGDCAFTRFDLDLLHALGEQLLVSLRGGETDEEQAAFLLSTVRALVSTIEAKDSHTSGHSARVHLLSMLLGKELGLPAPELEALKWASILHDVGKVGMPEAILHKPDPLTPEEFEIVKRHPQRGYQVMHHIRQLQEASQAVLLHHERFAGGGYPLGLAGEGIPRTARVIAVADTFDALTSLRPYRMSRSGDEAFAEMARVRGTQLDPQIVDAFEKMLPFLRENPAMLEASFRAA